MDRDKLKEKIAEAIRRKSSGIPFIGVSLEYADAALTAIESSGFVLMPKDEILR